ncbi:redoxin domain-containing protein [Hymenobacter qilianensis]|uniref:Redoxin domain-containing protein n=1 Tax=Hymenobacter qilianensis TaxID=1385715 RepID=A0A7H0GWJ1_9BACT|nr:redoxin domain-containing protein [Hymenobacter qilianensis]QNP52657.1 redoxin domain-containing protein [Hymenobacter qilianensis]
MCLVLATLPAFSQSPDRRPNQVATVYIFLAETCPISQQATLALRNLYTTYASRGVQFVGLFPDQQTAAADIAAFGRTFKVPFPLKLDSKKHLARRFQASITPEVVVAAADGRTVLYQGRIDNSYERLGQRRTVVTQHELRDALAAITTGKPVAKARTEAVGCFIAE